jgi:L-fucose isomerase-like protein
MGLFNIPSGAERITADAQRVAAEAHRAMSEGRRVFLARINLRMSDVGSTGTVPGAAEIIEAVESLGWRLEQMSFVSTVDLNGTEGYYLFRLLQPPAH